MRVLVIGGSGYVAGLTLPILAQQHILRIFDLRPLANPAWEHVVGDVGDPQALARAVEGMDALLYMAMGVDDLYSDEGVITAFDVNAKGLFLALRAAQQAGVSHAVFTSSMSIYDEPSLMARYFPDEEMTPDSRDVYGLTKRFGEEVCRYACRVWGMTINVLRLCFPQPADRWLAETRPGVPTLATTGEDVARALLAALERRFGGFEAFMISGDYEQRIMNMAKAKRLLGWEPLARPGPK